ncbi:MAG: tol-pal system YbgF family protein [Acidobacteriota bacterium]
MRKRLTRHQMLERDEFVGIAEKTILWAQDHRQTLVRGAVVVGIAAAVLLGASSYLRSRGRRADDLLGKAMSLRSAVVLEEGDTAPTDGSPTFKTRKERDEAVLALLDQLLEAYPHSKASTIAAFLRGTALFHMGQMDEAREALKSFTEDHPSSSLAARARHALGLLELEAGNAAKAVYLFQEMVDRPTPLLPLDSSLLGLAQAQEAAGLTAQAQETYRRLINEYPQSVFLDEANQAIARLGAAGGTPEAVASPSG